MALLAMMAAGPRHGYDLKSEFDAATGEAWPLNFGQVYTSLQRLQDDGLVERHETENGGHSDGRDRTPYRLNDTGRHDLDRWFDQPSPAPTSRRDELTVKLLMAIATGAADPNSVIETQRRSTLESLKEITARKAASEDLAALIQLDRRAALAEAEIRWLDMAEDRLAAERETTESELAER